MSTFDSAERISEGSTVQEPENTERRGAIPRSEFAPTWEKLMAAGQLQSASELAETYLAAESDDAVRICLIVTLITMGQRDRASGELTKVAETAGNNAWTWGAMAECYRRLGMLEHAARKQAVSDRLNNAAAATAAAAAAPSLSNMIKMVASATPEDMILKRLEFQSGSTGFLALPLISDDPIVTAYAAGEHPNRYMLDLLQMLTGPGDHVIDLGAHVGTFCVPAALMGRKVLAVDASRLHVTLIESSKRVNDLGSLSVVHCAVTNTEGAVPFTENGLFSAVDFTGTASAGLTVPGQRLSRLLDEYGFGYVHMIKMDIEGSELVGLESISSLLECEDGPAIIYESNEETFSRAGYSVPEFRRWLEARGYRTFRTEGARWIYAPPDQPQPELWVDVLALKLFHQRRFASLIDETWDEDAMQQRFFTWASLPHDSTRDHVVSVLENWPPRGQYPRLEKLATELSARKLEASKS